MRILLVVCLLIFLSPLLSAKGVNSSSAAYFLQVSSNLKCDTLEVNLIGQTNQIEQTLAFKNAAFSAVELAPDTYHFSHFSCASAQNGTADFEIPLSSLSPIVAKAGQSYFGGKLIVKQLAQSAGQEAPDVLDNCPTIISKARGTASNSCTDGVGVNTGPSITNQIHVYAPILSHQEINQVRTALQANEAQLAYIPLITQVR